MLKSSLCFVALFFSTVCQAIDIAPSRPSSTDAVVFTDSFAAPCIVFDFHGGHCDTGGAPVIEVGGAIGGTVQIEPGFIVFDFYISDGRLPQGVPELPAVFSSSTSSYYGNTNPRAIATFGFVLQLAPGAYVVGTRYHHVAPDGTVQYSDDGSPTILNVQEAGRPIESTLAVEFYNQAKDHYFLSANPAEISDLDQGVHPGWSRTGQSLGVFVPQRSGGVGVPVCRFYGLPSAGIDSHFYTSDMLECLGLPSRFGGAWVPEAISAFEVMLPQHLPAFGCPVGTVPVYRLWNKRADSNHRYTTDVNIARAMVAQGWFWEGNETVEGIVGIVGGPFIFMCSILDVPAVASMWAE